MRRAARTSVGTKIAPPSPVRRPIPAIHGPWIVFVFCPNNFVARPMKWITREFIVYDALYTECQRRTRPTVTS